jgi:hypothetical protein
MTLTEKLLRVADTYCAATKTGHGTLSAIILGKGSRLGEVRDNNADFNTRTFERAIDWLSRHWPADTPWPDDVDRFELNEDGSLSRPTCEVAPAVAAAVSGSSPSTSTEPEVPHG